MSGQKLAYEHRLDSLVAAFRALGGPWNVSNGARPAAADSVTTQLGPLTIVADKTEQPLVESAVRRVDTLFSRMFGSASPSFHGWNVRLHADSVSGKIVHMVWLRDPTGAARGISEMDPTAAALGDAIVLRAGMIAGRLTDSTFRAWLGNDGLVDLHRPNDFDWTATWMDVAGIRNRLVGSCVSGDIRSCAVALDLVSAPPPFHDWYTAGERDTMAIEWVRGYGHMPPPSAHACVYGGSRPACDSVLLDPSGPRIDSPLAGSPRRTLTELALAIGPPGALTRLIQTTGSPSQRLAAVAGVSTDSLIALWRHNVFAIHHAPDVTSIRALVVALLWSALLALLALRSSRWR